MEANRQNVPEGELIRRDEAQIEPAEQNLTPEELLNASTVSSIEVAYATKLGKLKPYGYDKATGIVKESYGQTTDAHCVWLLSQAQSEGKEEDLQRDFPDVVRRAKRIVTHMEKNNPNDMKGIMTRVKREDWSLDNVRQSQEAVSKFASALLKSMKETKE